MYSQLEAKATALERLLEANKLTKLAGETITHKKLVSSQNDLGAEQTRDLQENTPGVLASTPEASNDSIDGVQEIVGAQSLNAAAEKALKSSGTTVNNMLSDGTPTGTPEEHMKTAAYQANLAKLVTRINKEASLRKQASAEIPTATDAMTKLASLGSNPTQAQILDAEQTLNKLAALNPVFQACRDNILMRKLAEDVEALAEAEGTTPEDAAAALEAVAEANPEMLEEANDEATGEALSTVADAEALDADTQTLADNASAFLGAEVTSDDIVAALDEVQAQADELGVPPEALVEAAMEEMIAAEGEPSEEDLAAAQELLDAAAEQGVAPEEVLQMASEELGDAPAAEEAAAAAPACECGDPNCDGGCKKTASLHCSDRVNFVRSLIHG